jgi:hypothetical protein
MLRSRQQLLEGHCCLVVDGLDPFYRGLKDQRRRPEGGEWEPIKISLRNSAYAPSSNPKAKTLQESDEHTNQQYRNDLLKVMNTTEKE